MFIIIIVEFLLTNNESYIIIYYTPVFICKYLKLYYISIMVDNTLSFSLVMLVKKEIYIP